FALRIRTRGPKQLAKATNYSDRVTTGAATSAHVHTKTQPLPHKGYHTLLAASLLNAAQEVIPSQADFHDPQCRLRALISYPRFRATHLHVLSERRAPRL